MLQRKLLVNALIAGLFLVAVPDANAANVSLCYSGFGFQAGLVIPDDVDMRDVDNDAPNFLYDDIDIGMHLAMQGDIGIALGTVGQLHYWPSGGVWLGGGDHVFGGDDYDMFAMEVLLNIFDVYYQFPVPILVKPFVGLGPTITIMIGRWENQDRNNDGRGADPALGMNLFAGAHFDVSPHFRFFAEMRGKFSEWDLFRLSGGMTFGVGR